MNKKLWIACGALLLVVAVLVGIYFATKPQAQEGSKTITVEVVHADKTSKTFTYTTDEQYLGAVLLAEGLVKGESSQYGLYIQEVDGEKTSDTDKTYWALYEGQTPAATGADAVIIVDGGVYKLALESYG